MAGERQRRYPSSLFTRQHLEPIETLRAAVLDRDEETCSAHDVAITGRYWSGVLPCASELVVVSALDAHAMPEPSPILLRTFCSTHAALATASTPALGLLFLMNGWRIPPLDDALLYAGRLPVRHGPSWWLLDHWGERHLMPDEWAAEARAELHARWLR